MLDGENLLYEKENTPYTVIDNAFGWRCILNF